MPLHNHSMIWQENEHAKLTYMCAYVACNNLYVVYKNLRRTLHSHKVLTCYLNLIHRKGIVVLFFCLCLHATLLHLCTSFFVCARIGFSSLFVRIWRKVRCIFHVWMLSHYRPSDRIAMFMHTPHLCVGRRYGCRVRSFPKSDILFSEKFYAAC